jgi:fatty acid desaturase
LSVDDGLVLSTGSQFTPLMRAVRGAGLLRLRRRRYALLIGADLAALAGVWAVVWLVGNSWWQLMLALPAAVFTVRMIFVGHDIGHHQVARTGRVNAALGMVVGDLIVGLNARWWIDRHVRHHANPNQVGRDPDVGPGALAWTPEQASRRRGTARWLTQHQGRLFFPMLLLEAFNLHAASLRAAKRPRDVALLVVHVAAYLGLLLTVMSPLKVAVFVAAHQALVGLHLGCSFAPNHKGMAMPPLGSRWSFLHKQVLTSRNVRGGVLVDWLLGGLNYQTEHHLFPMMPRVHLRRARPLVRAHCASLGLAYTEETLARSLWLATAHLNEVGQRSDAAPVSSPGC